MNPNITIPNEELEKYQAQQKKSRRVLYAPMIENASSFSYNPQMQYESALDFIKSS
jgi:hypothetical protein